MKLSSSRAVRRTLLGLGCTVLSAFSAVGAAQTNPVWSGHASYVLGYKGLESAWEPVDHQVEWGLIDIDLKPPGWPISICGQLLLTYADEVPDLEQVRGDYSGVWELNLGARKVWQHSDVWQPFLGGGVSLLGGSASTFVETSEGGFQDYEDSDYGLGAWAGGGLYWHFSRHWHAGIQLQYSWGEITLFSTKLNPGGFHALAMFGYHW